MKTIKTANGIKKIEDWNAHLVPIQLRSILQEHRSILIDKLIQGGLQAYIDYTFSMKAAPKLMEQIKDALTTLKHDGIDSVTYAPMFDAVLHNDFTMLDNALFYSEINTIIKSTLFQPQLFPETQHVLFNGMSRDN